jgi:hypothetical protein
MIVLLLPILDILTASVIVLHTYFGLPYHVVLIHGFYLGMKGMLFAKTDFASKIDILCSVYIMIAAFGLFVNPIVTLVIAVWLVQKAVFLLAPLK